MKQKLALSCALIHRPDVLFLDEPTTGVDAVSRREFWDMLSQLKTQGITILVSTPYMDEASRCDRIALCNEGHILGVNTPQNFVHDFNEMLYGIRAKDMFSLLQRTRSIEGVAACYPFGEYHHLIANDNFNPSIFTSQLSDLEGLEICTQEPSIEDVFIKLMKQ